MKYTVLASSSRCKILHGVTGSVASWKRNVDPEAGAYVSTQASHGQAVPDELPDPCHGLLVGPQVLRCQLISVDAIGPIGGLATE